MIKDLALLHGKCYPWVSFLFVRREEKRITSWIMLLVGNIIHEVMRLEEKATSLSPSTVIFFVISYVSPRESLLVREVARL
jgi:hypothetical protein